MATEAQRQFLRIAPNYARLGATLLVGIALTQVQLAWLGSDGFGLVALLGATMGLGSIFQDITRQSLVREMAAAYRTDSEAFRRAYNSAYIICLVTAALAAIAFALIIAIVPLLRITEELQTPARVLVAGEGVAILLMILLAPAYNMYVVKERFIAHNLFTTLKRANYLVAAAGLYFVFGVTDPVLGVTLYGIVPAALNSGLLLTAVAIIALGDRRLIPSPRRADRGAVSEIVGTFSWNSGVVLAMNLHERVAALIMNLAFGLWGNTVFGLALRLTSYVRMATMGMTFGVDAVSARIASEHNPNRMRSLVEHSTRLHAITAIPGAIAVWILAEPMLTLWVGRFLDDPDGFIPFAVTLVRIMMIGLACRAISDGWMRILYGAGHVRRYAPMVLIGGLSNPLLAVVLLVVLPDDVRYTSVGWGYTAVFVVVHFIALPVIGARAMELSVWSLLKPTARPLIASIVAMPALLFVSRRPDETGWTLIWLLAAGAAYAAVYGACCAAFVLQPAERVRLFRAVRRTLLRGA